MTEPNVGPLLASKDASTLLTQAAAAAQPRTATDAEEIQQIVDAILRLLYGVPLRSDGKLTIKSLAAEADLRRNKLTHKHTGLKDLFYALVKAQNSTPKATEDLERHNAALRKEIAELKNANRDLTEQVKLFARVVHVLEVENHQLREAASGTGNVRPLRSATLTGPC
jgi:hypothetical protein